VTRTLKPTDRTQLPLFQPESDWKPPSGFMNLEGVKRLAIDVETKDVGLDVLGPGVRRGAFIVGYAIGTDDGRRAYYPVRHEGGGNLDARMVERWLTAEAAKFSGEVVGAGLLYDLDFMAEVGIHFKNARRFRDVQVAEPLLDEHRLEYNLDALARTWLGESKREDLLKAAAIAWGFGTTNKAVKTNLWRLPAKLVGAYGEGDADLPLRVLERQETALHEQQLMELFDLESRLIPILLAMRRRGVRVDLRRAEEVSSELGAERDALHAEFRRLTACPKAELFAPDSFGAALAAMDIPVPMTEKTRKWSIKKEWLKEMASRFPVLKLLLDARSLDKCKETFVDTYIFEHNVNGRIHTEFHQLKSDDGGTIGRFSSSNPNLQNIPARDERLGPLVRSLFIPEEDEEWERDDYSQIEVRFEAHYAVGRGAREFRLKYVNDPKTDYHKFIAELLHVDPEDKIKRKKVKNTNFAKKYGAMAPKLAVTFGCSITEAEAFVKEYEAACPWTKETFDLAQRRAAERGYIKTVLGRFARFPLWEPASNGRKKMKDRVPALPRGRAEKEYPGEVLVRAHTYTAMNRLFQLGSADLMKKAMVDIWDAGCCGILGAPLLTVHDELDWSVPKTMAGDAAAKEVKRLMETAITLRVPIIAEAERGAHWGECK